MMTRKTTDSINSLANILAQAFVDNVTLGLTTRAQMNDLARRTKRPGDLELIKTAIRFDKKAISEAAPRMGSSANLTNIMKRAKHFDALATGVLGGIRAYACLDRDFRNRYIDLFRSAGKR